MSIVTVTNTFTRENVPLSQVEKLKILGLLKRNILESIFARHHKKLQMSCDVFIALLNKLNILEPSHDPELGDYFFLVLWFMHQLQILPLKSILILF